jgi:acyl carrier protein
LETDRLMRDKIKALFDEIWWDDKECEPPELTDDTVLLDTGLDSMALGILVTRLDEELGIDPFIANDDAVYPRTFGEFVKVYVAASSNR